MCSVSAYLTPLSRYGASVTFWLGEPGVIEAQAGEKSNNDFSRQETRFPGAGTGSYG